MVSPGFGMQPLCSFTHPSSCLGVTLNLNPEIGLCNASCVRDARSRTSAGRSLGSSPLRAFRNGSNTVRRTALSILSIPMMYPDLGSGSPWTSTSVSYQAARPRGPGEDAYELLLLGNVPTSSEGWMENLVVLESVVGTWHRFPTERWVSETFRRTIGHKRLEKLEKVSQTTVLLRRLIEIVLFSVTPGHSGLPVSG